MSEAKSPEFRPFTSTEARDRFLAHYDAKEKSWPVNFASRMVRTEHGETFIRVSGPAGAPPLVLLPGGQSSSLIWRRLIAPLSAQYRTYALDAIYDVGRSVPARPIRDVRDLIAWLDGVLDGLDLSDGISVMGLSYGAYASAEYAVHAPQRLKKMVWLSPAMIVAAISHEFVDRMRPLVVPDREPLEAFVRWIMPGLAALDEREIDDRVDEILLIRASYTMWLPVVGRAVFSDDELNGIEVPVLYIVGENDGAVDNAREAVARVNAVAPRIETMLIPDTGHDAIVVRPQLIADRVLQFLEE